MKSGRFHGEIRQISWNLADFMVKSSGFHGKFWQISWWNLANFMKFCGFHEIRKSAGFHHEICQISDFMKSGRFHIQIASFAYEIWQISWWNPMDFIHEIRRISWLILKSANFFYYAYNFFFYVNQISNSLAMGSPRLSLWLGTISSS